MLYRKTHVNHHHVDQILSVASWETPRLAHVSPISQDHHQTANPSVSQALNVQAIWPVLIRNVKTLAQDYAEPTQNAVLSVIPRYVYAVQAIPVIHSPIATSNETLNRNILTHAILAHVEQMLFVGNKMERDLVSVCLSISEILMKDVDRNVS